MRRLIDRCAGIDVGQALLVVCLRVVDEDGKVREQVRSFGATTPDLLDLRDWLTAAAVTHAAMESTGVSSGGLNLVNRGNAGTRPRPGGRTRDTTGYRCGAERRRRHRSSTGSSRRGVRSRGCGAGSWFPSLRLGVWARA